MLNEKFSVTVKVFEVPILKWNLGNKSDLEGKRKVSKEQGQKFAAENGMKFCETSGKENLNVELAFMTVLIQQ